MRLISLIDKQKVSLNYLTGAYADYFIYRHIKQDMPLSKLLERAIQENNTEVFDAVYNEIPAYLNSLKPRQLSSLLKSLSVAAVKSPNRSGRVLLKRVIDSWNGWQEENFNETIVFADNNGLNHLTNAMLYEQDRFTKTKL